MDSLKKRIVEKLEYLPEVALQEVLDFVNFLEWRKTNSQESLPSVAKDDSWEEDDTAWLESDISHLESYKPYRLATRRDR